MASLLLLLVSLAAASAAGGMRAYNHVNVSDLSSRAQLYEFFSAAARGRQNVLLGSARPECWELMSSPFLRGAHRKSPADHVAIATIPAEELPEELGANECAQVLWYPVGSPLSVPSRRTTDFGHVALSRWLHETFAWTVLLRNGFSFPISVFFETESDDANRGGVFQGTLGSGEGTVMRTFLGHLFTARAAGQGAAAQLVDFVLVSGAPEYVFSSEHYLNGDEGCVGASGAEARQTCPNVEFIKHETTFSSWHRSRLALNFVQPKIVRAVTSEGFKKMRVPETTFSWLKDWYDNKKIEEASLIEGRAGPCMNQMEAPSLILHLSPDLKSRMADELRPVLQAWYEGSERLKMTSIYGIRTYTNGSILAMHVDTLATHVVSAIINVDQDVDEPWKLKILDHQDNEVDITMAPGDMVLYESAKLLHGRPDLMKGRRYENIFIHYMPETGWDEYRYF